ALDVLKSVAAQCSRSNLIEPALDVVCPRVSQPHLSTVWLKVLVPDVMIAFRRRWALVLLDERQVHALSKIDDGYDSFGRDYAAATRSTVPLGFAINI